jgi:hypothetical protein
MVNSSTPVSTNRGYRKPGDGNENTIKFNNPRIQGAIDDIDSDVHTQVGRIDTLETEQSSQGTRIGDLETDVTNIDGDIVSIESDITNLQNLKREIQSSPTVTPAVYDEDGNLTTYEDGQSRFQNAVYTEGRLDSYEQVVNGVTYLVTLNYDPEDNFLSLTSVAQ